MTIWKWKKKTNRKCKPD